MLTATAVRESFKSILLASSRIGIFPDLISAEKSEESHYVHNYMPDNVTIIITIPTIMLEKVV